MAPRQPSDKPDDDNPSKLQQVIENAPDHAAPARENRVSKTECDAQEEDVELDRIEAYLRGPTAFTA
ncbi:hypothetical protein [Microvirga arabica]|uniref:hypothetical protein n=1 Tax=Microvirga arabica TaxID=1128671 RepID=UPI00193A34CD|nr:hypothetical protein [Microvirga arabica]MBM1174576.1 hypothetical protein [Microvirga arabica]